MVREILLERVKQKQGDWLEEVVSYIVRFKKYKFMTCA